MKKIYLIIFLALSFTLVSNAQGGGSNRISADENTSRFAFSTNAVDWAWFVTPNIDLQYAVGRRFTIEATAKFNGWTFFDQSAEKRNRQCRQEYSLGMRFWPWYTYSGWWVGAEAQYQEYSRRPVANVFRKEEGDAAGVALSAGYSIQVLSWFNIDVGLGFWGGQKWYKTYESVDRACPECGKRVDRLDGSDAPSQSFFLMPDEARIALMFIF